MLKLAANGQTFKHDGVETIILVSENRIWNIREDGLISYWGPADYFSETLEGWQTTDIDDVMDLHDIFDTLRKHAFLWPEYKYLLDKENEDDEF